MALPPGTKANTGEKCPQGGDWHPVGNPTEERSIGIGNIMPPIPKGETHWVLKRATGDNQGAASKALEIGKRTAKVAKNALLAVHGTLLATLLIRALSELTAPCRPRLMAKLTGC